MDFDKDYEGFIDPTPEQLADIVQSMKYSSSDIGSSLMINNLDMNFLTQKEEKFVAIKNRSVRLEPLENR